MIGMGKRYRCTNWPAADVDWCRTGIDPREDPSRPANRKQTHHKDYNTADDNEPASGGNFDRLSCIAHVALLLKNVNRENR